MKNVNFVFLKDENGDVASQLQSLSQNHTLLTYIEHYDKANDKSGILACYMDIGGGTDESNGSVTK